MKLIDLNVGDIVISVKPAVISTIVGSCVAVALWDSKRCIGGMTHYLLPDPHNQNDASNPNYGSIAIPKLFHAIVSLGANKDNIQAKVCGGGSMQVDREGGKIAHENVSIAFHRLKKLEIPIVNMDVGGIDGRKILFYTESGKVLVKKLGYPNFNLG